MGGGRPSSVQSKASRAAVSFFAVLGQNLESPQPSMPISFLSFLGLDMPDGAVYGPQTSELANPPANGV
ncbi:hypothetical protein CTA1_3325 [Colletotrichum tanaceti]|uniref:Uncharacterized protein n=1 Tax=Colletotrichum tanaceti TaxID=1306861 RepID=A0A4U6XH63_9PEZI|nr:hypothetical protein CTA1_3325 [Colletotrichum tanaceti]